MQLPNLNENGRKALPYIVVALVFLFGGAAIGWALKPEKVRIEERLKLVEVEKQVVVEKEVVRVEVVHVKDTQVVERWHREKTEEKKPDGTVVTKEVEDKNIDSVVKEKETATKVQIVEVTKEVVVYRDKEVIVKQEPVLPKWYVGIMGGTELLAPVPVLGVEGKYRFAGPFWLGAYGQANTQLSRGQVGASLGIQF